jgi:hypothetical protein
MRFDELLSSNFFNDLIPVGIAALRDARCAVGGKEGASAFFLPKN